jgi:hypothetical protein
MYMANLWHLSLSKDQEKKILQSFHLKWKMQEEQHQEYQLVQHSAGATSITLGGTGTGTLKAGDFIKFANHDKVYMVVADQADISTGTLTIEPPLTTAVSSSTIVYDNVPFTVYLTNDIQEFGVVGNDKDGNLLYQFEIDLEEAL